MHRVLELSEPTVRDTTVRVVRDPGEIDELRWFQTRRYFDQGLLNAMPAELPSDPAVARSTYFGVYGARGEIEASARLLWSSGELPVLGYRLYPAAADALDARRDMLAEVSRVAVARTTRPHHALGLLAREFFHHCLRNGEATALVATIEPPLIRILDRALGIPVEVVGPVIEHYQGFNGACVPVLIDLVRYLTEARFRNHARWRFFTDGLVIDLTDGALAGEPTDDMPVGSDETRQAS